MRSNAPDSKGMNSMVDLFGLSLHLGNQIDKESTPK